MMMIIIILVVIVYNMLSIFHTAVKVASVRQVEFVIELS